MTTSNPHGPTRRMLLKGLAGAAWASLVAAAGLGLGAALRLAGAGGGPSSPAPVIIAGTPEPGGVLAVEGVALARDAGGLYALSLVCPHLGCRPVWRQAQGRFLCPCHGSTFAADGARLEGPAPRSLEHIALSRNADGGFMAYPGRTVDAAWRLGA